MDITKLLTDWPFEPGQVNARLIPGDDGEPKVQVRLDLGLIQLTWSGRPDGQTPFGFPSLLDYHESRHDTHALGDLDDPDDPEFPRPKAGPAGEPQGESDPGESVEPGEPGTPAARGADSGMEDEGEFFLSAEDCRLLRDEAVQYYHRYVALLVLEEYEAVVRDTTRNLRLLEFCGQHAKDESDRTILEQFRPYIMMMRARALASMALKDDHPKASVFALDESLDEIQRYFADRGSPELFEQSAEVEALKGMREALVPRLPVSQKSELKQRLQRALDQENYELAAILRDELRQIKEDK
jgi:UvrB/uvrC motif